MDAKGNRSIKVKKNYLYEKREKHIKNGEKTASDVISIFPKNICLFYALVVFGEIILIYTYICT